MTNSKILTYGLLGLFITVFIYITTSCDSGQKITNYDILSVEKSNNSTRTYVVYKDTNYSKIELEKVLIDVNKNNKDTNLYFTAYLFTSLNIAQTDKSAWISMLEKDPSNSEPVITFNEMKLSGIQEASDNIIDENDIALSNLKAHLSQKNVELCTLYNELSNMELGCSRQADLKYPEKGGLKHYEYTKELIGTERKKIAEKYNLNDTIFSTVAVFAMTYCK